jgi:hypothetical protein
MNYRVRIIKRGQNEVSTGGARGQDEKAGRQSTRDIAGTVKGWIAERHRRRREEELASSQFKKLP